MAQQRTLERANSIARQIAQTPIEERHALYREVERLLRLKSQNFQASHFVIIAMRENDPESVRLTNA